MTGSGSELYSAEIYPERQTSKTGSYKKIPECSSRLRSCPSWAVRRQPRPRWRCTSSASSPRESSRPTRTCCQTSDDESCPGDCSSLDSESFDGTRKSTSNNQQHPAYSQWSLSPLRHWNDHVGTTPSEIRLKKYDKVYNCIKNFVFLSSWRARDNSNLIFQIVC